ncbi:MAG: peptidylprolyl isomerase [Lachnospiraceae bacterium]|nr:peptidylprolyl isomerase [Lachnospiraceae bacterium]
MFRVNGKLIRMICLLMILCMAAAFSGCSDNKGDTPLQFTGGKQCRLARINFKDYGSVSFRLYKDEEPELVEKFIEACKNGVFDGMTLQNVIEDYVLIAGCDPADPAYNAKYEHKGKLYPYKGALCASGSGTDTRNASAFQIIGLPSDELKNMEELIEHEGYTFSDYIKFGYETELTREELDLFMEYGGAPWLTGHAAVFGQAYEGLDILEKVMASYSEDEGADIIIESIETD